MSNWIKKMMYSIIGIIFALAIEYVNNIYLHNLVIYILTYALLVELLILLISICLENKRKKPLLHDKMKIPVYRIREKIDAKIMMEELDLKKFFRKQYINNELDNRKKMRQKKVYYHHT